LLGLVRAAEEANIWMLEGTTILGAEEGRLDYSFTLFAHWMRTKKLPQIFGRFV
jgi:hypothetical protein